MIYHSTMPRLKFSVSSKNGNLMGFLCISSATHVQLREHHPSSRIVQFGFQDFEPLKPKLHGLSSLFPSPKFWDTPVELGICGTPCPFSATMNCWWIPRAQNLSSSDSHPAKIPDNPCWNLMFCSSKKHQNHPKSRWTAQKWWNVCWWNPYGPVFFSMCSLCGDGSKPWYPWWTPK